MADLATAYLRLIPSLKGAQKTIESELGGINTKSAGSKLGGGLGDGITAGIGKIAIGSAIGNVLSQGVSAAAGAAVDAFKSAFDNAANFEQLAGGVETLFGETADKAMENAQKAFKTAGISANEYMEQVNSFAASLRQSLGPERAGELADYADKAVQDMADNANKMGTQMESIQNAYQGFAKQNYTMLDNLKLGYGGTKSEMERLLADASKIAGVEFNIDSYSDVIDAIHVIQEDMGIAGTTAEEAAHTVSGSISMLQSSWTNLLTEFGKSDGDIGARVQELVDSIGAVIENVVPMIGNILPNMGGAITNLISQAALFIHENKDQIADGAIDMFLGFVNALAEIAPGLLSAVVELILALARKIIERAPDILIAIGTLMNNMRDGILGGIANAGQAMDEVMGGVLNSIGNFFHSIFDAGANIIQSLIDGILSGLSNLGKALGDVGKFIVDHKGPPSYDAVMLKPNAELIMGGLTDTIIDGIPALNRAMQMVNGAIALNPAISATSTPNATPAAAELSIYVTVEGREGEDDYALGRKVGAAISHELKMQGVTA